MGLCKSRAALRRFDEAVSDCGNVLVLDSANREAKLLVVRLLLDAERFDEAQVKAREFLGQHQQDGEFHEVRRAAGLGDGACWGRVGAPRAWGVGAMAMCFSR